MRAVMNHQSMWLREEGERVPIGTLHCWETEINQSGVCSSPDCGYAGCVLVHGLGTPGWDRA